MSGLPIEFESLSKSYRYGLLGRRQDAVTDLTLSVPRNSIYGFLGANGAGKTTCIKMLLGLQFPDHGRVRLFGGDPAHPETKRLVGYLPERPYFHDSFTAGGFLDFHRRLFGGAAERRSGLSNQELLALVGLSDTSDKPLRGFSKGMLQRAGIAQALVNDPELLVLDEPMSGLDPVGRREVRDLIQRLHSLGKTIFFSSHILTDVENICHRIAFLEKGRLRHEGALAEMRNPQGAAVEVTFNGVAEKARSASTILKAAYAAGAYWRIDCEHAGAARAAAEEVWRLGGELVSYHPESRSLEDFLFGEGSRR